MNDWIAKALGDLKRGSWIQFVFTVILIIAVTGYEVTRSLSPITTSTILYWEDGFTNAEIERSNIHTLCDRLNGWPMNVFIEQDPVIKDRCKVLKRRHMLRTADDWKLYQERVKKLQAKKAKYLEEQVEENEPKGDVKIEEIYRPP